MWTVILDPSWTKSLVTKVGASATDPAAGHQHSNIIKGCFIPVTYTTGVTLLCVKRATRVMMNGCEIVEHSRAQSLMC